MSTPVARLNAPYAASKLPYLGSLVLAELGSSPSKLSGRVGTFIKKMLPVPVEQELIWADVVFGTRSHGLVATDAGLFVKDGPSAEDDDDTDWSREEGAGYHYFRWRNFDPSVFSFIDTKPAVAGKVFCDSERFEALVKACVRINARRESMRKEGAAALRETHIQLQKRIETAFCKTAAESYKRVVAILEGCKGGAPCLVEVPSTQYDAIAQRLMRAAEVGKLDGIDRPQLAGGLLIQSPFTYRQARNIACLQKLDRLSYDEDAQALSCSYPFGLGSLVLTWLSGRSAVQGLDPARATGPDGLARIAFATAATLPHKPSDDPRVSAAGTAAASAMYTAGRSLGYSASRVLISALGIASGPFAGIAGLALGNLCAGAAPQAFAMAKNLFIEPAEQVFGRLFDGVLHNMLFEEAFTQAEQVVLAAFMQNVSPDQYACLMNTLRESTRQEQDIRDFLEPIFASVRAI